MRLIGKRIIVGICGGIAAYKIPGLIRLLIKEGAEVQTVVTENGARFVGKAALSTLTGRPVIDTLFPDNVAISTEHISSSDWADALLIAPATANALAKCANGIADDFLSTLYLSLTTPVVFAPAMNTRMWDHAAVQANVATLKNRGHTVVQPDSGELACGTTGAGRLPTEERLVLETIKAVTPQSLSNKKMLITLGGTQEALDPVRTLGNKSSGKMGVALAEEAFARGAEVTLLYANITAPLPAGIPAVQTLTVDAMKSEIEKRLPSSDILIMAAAVSDFTPEMASSAKIKKSEQGLTLSLKATPDILKSTLDKRGHCKVVGFALEDQEGEKNGLAKLKAKGCALMVLNSPETLGSDTNRITLLKSDGTVLPFEPCSKTKVACHILDAIQTT